MFVGKVIGIAAKYFREFFKWGFIELGWNLTVVTLKRKVFNLKLKRRFSTASWRFFFTLQVIFTLFFIVLSTCIKYEF